MRWDRQGLVSSHTREPGVRGVGDPTPFTTVLPESMRLGAKSHSSEATTLRTGEETDSAGLLA